MKKILVVNREVSLKAQKNWRNAMEILTDNEKLKGLFKQAIIEVMEERKDLVHEVLIEAIEDAGMIDAIREGEKTGPASRSEVLDILEGKA